MDKELIEKRIISKHLKKIANEYYWLGVVAGLIGGFAAGYFWPH